jgi:hypothetical protein
MNHRADSPAADQFDVVYEIWFPTATQRSPGIASRRCGTLKMRAQPGLEVAYEDHGGSRQSTGRNSSEEGR